MSGSGDGGGGGGRVSGAATHTYHQHQNKVVKNLCSNLPYEARKCTSSPAVGVDGVGAGKGLHGVEEWGQSCRGKEGNRAARDDEKEIGVAKDRNEGRVL